MKVNCLISQSGGPTAVINNSLVGLIDEIKLSGFNGNIYGSVGGIQGLLTENFVDLSRLKNEERIRLRWTPGSALGTCRYKLTVEESETIVRILKKHNIHYFFYIGGNGSMQIAKMIEDAALFLRYDLIVIGIPKSIDNDLLETDHTPGYGSAAKFLTTSLMEMQMDVASYPDNNRVTIIETMGRHTGWLAAACSLATNNEQSHSMIYIPEVPFDLDDCIHKINTVHEEKRNSFIIVSEGICNKEGQLINQKNVEFDNLERPILGGIASYLQEAIEKNTGILTRAVTPSIWQRSSVLLSSKTDVDEAYEVGRKAWLYAEKEMTGVMIGIDRLYSEDQEYLAAYNPKKLQNVAGKEKYVPTEWYDQKNNTMKKEFIEYVSPLIQGEMIIPMLNGLPSYTSVV